MRRMILGLVVLAGVSCSQQKEGTVIIHGSFPGAPGIRLAIEEFVPSGAVLLDSVITGPDGSFRFAVSPDGATFYLLKSGNGKAAVLSAAPGDTLELTCDPEAFPGKMVVTGNEDARILGEFFARSYRNKAMADSVQEILSFHAGDSLFTALAVSSDTVFQRIWKDQRELETRFLEEHPASLATLLVLDFSFGTRPVLSMEEDPGYYRRTDSALTAKYPGNKHVLHFHQKIEEFTRKQQLEQGVVR